MDLGVFALVMLAASLHAGWSTMVKARLDPFTSLTLVATGWSVLAIPGLFFVPAPDPTTWAYIGLSTVLHLIYKLVLAATYRAGDLGQVYPISRGSAPLLTVLGAYLIAEETLQLLQLLGISGVVTGIFMLSVKGQLHFQARAVGLALITGLCIASYSLVDGLGVRIAERPAIFIIYLFVFDGGSMLLYALLRHRSPTLTAIRSHWHLGLIGGAMALIAYAISLWAMTQAPIGLVAAVRESSVLFAVLFGMVWLRERLSFWRVTAALCIALGLLFIKV